MRIRSSLAALLAIAVVTSVLACGSGGGGGGAGSSASAVSRGGGVIRLVGFDRRALSPSASPRVTLVVERAGAQPSDFILEESADGVTYARAALLATPVPHPTAIVFEVALPAASRHYRVSAPAPSNVVTVVPGSGAVGPLAVVAPASGASGVSRDPQLATAGGAGARSFLFAIADAEGTLVWLAEGPSGFLAPSAGGAIPFIAAPAGGLAGGAAHVAAVVGLDGTGFGVAGASRVAFTTAP